MRTGSSAPRARGRALVALGLAGRRGLARARHPAMRSPIAAPLGGNESRKRPSQKGQQIVETSLRTP